MFKKVHNKSFNVVNVIVMMAKKYIYKTRFLEEK